MTGQTLEIDSAAKLDAVPLPPSYSWGDWAGDYRKIMREGREVCRVGGVTARVCSGSMKGEIYRAIMSGEVKRAEECWFMGGTYA